jgi:mannan endo-1,4-beta-mannosidase
VQRPGFFRRWGALSLLLGSACAAPVTQPRVAAAPIDAAGFELEGQPFCFAGSNNYYPIYKPKPVVDELFASARALGLTVMRVWGMLDRGSLDGSVPDVDGEGHKQGVYFQYWDPAAGRPAYHEGENGLARLDYVLAAAAANDIKLIVVLVNNWRDFGGVAQYLTWYGRAQHHEFFTAPEVRRAYQDWVSHLIGRTNTVNGRKYRDDPTIVAWELANEPRCKGGGAFDRDSGWDTSTITTWAHEMSSFIKSLDPNHLVSVGDEGFLDWQGEHFAYRANDGVDHAALTALPHVDFGTFHLYPDEWGAEPGFGERWIEDHLAVARGLGKPTLLEEYGSKVTRSRGTLGSERDGLERRLQRYRSWNERVLALGGVGALPWMLSAGDAGQPRYPDYDGFAFYGDDATGQLLARYAERYRTAPHCRPFAASGGERSAYVRVRRGR